MEQSFQINSNGVRKTITSPGEKGSHLIKIEITDFSDIKNVAVGDRWKYVAKKAIFLTKTSSDPLYKDVNKILKNVLQNLKNIKDIRKTELTIGSTSSRFKPY